MITSVCLRIEESDLGRKGRSRRFAAPFFARRKKKLASFSRERERDHLRGGNARQRQPPSVGALEDAHEARLAPHGRHEELSSPLLLCQHRIPCRGTSGARTAP